MDDRRVNSFEIILNVTRFFIYNRVKWNQKINTEENCDRKITYINVFSWIQKIWSQPKYKCKTFKGWWIETKKETDIEIRVLTSSLKKKKKMILVKKERSGNFFRLYIFDTSGQSNERWKKKASGYFEWDSVFL